MSDLTIFQRYYELGDRLIEQATKEQLAECLRLLALDLAQYQLKYGELMLEKTLAFSLQVEPNEEQLNLLALGMANLAGVVESVIQTA
jgi:hypothetical protein